MSENIHIKNCPVCGKSEALPFLTCKDCFVTREEFLICKCSACNFAFTQDFPSEKIISKYYQSAEYVSHTDTKRGIVNKLYHLARSITLKYKSKLITKNSNNRIGKLLDIGCGTGYFLNKMKEMGWIVDGIEASASVREHVKNQFGIKVQDSASLFSKEEKSFDVVTMWHVLEHLEHLHQVMTSLHKMLKDDGVAFIALPNKDSYDACHYKHKWAAYDVPRHLWHFSPTDFKMLAEKYHFELIALKPMYFDSFYISMLSEKNKKVPLSAFVGLLKGGIFFFRSLFNTKRCSSVVYILKKQK